MFFVVSLPLAAVVEPGAAGDRLGNGVGRGVGGFDVGGGVGGTGVGGAGVGLGVGGNVTGGTFTSIAALIHAVSLTKPYVT